MKYFIKLYNDNYIRLYSCLSKDKGMYKRLIFEKNNNFDSELSSLSRTKKNIREICLCNEFEYFCTWTVSSIHADRFSLQSVQDLMHKTLKAYRRKNPSFKYIFITEKHKNGAFHFHGLIKGINKNDLVINKNYYLDFPFFSTKIGFCTVSPIVNYNKCCNYITKYITKDCIRNEHNQIYFCSKGLIKARKEEIKNFDYLEFSKYFGDFKYRDEFTQISDYNINELTQEQILFFMNLNRKYVDF